MNDDVKDVKGRPRCILGSVRARRIVLAGALLVGAALGVVWLAGWELSRPMPATVGPAPPNLQAQSVVFPSESGSTIHGWFSPGEKGRGAVLLLGGWGDSRLRMLDRAVLLHHEGYSALLIDLQGTGESHGNAITYGWRERLDVLAAVAWLKNREPEEPVGIIGFSLGGAAATLAAPKLDIQAAVLEGVYPSIEAAIDNRLRIHLGPWGPALAPALLLQLRPRMGVGPAALRPIDHVAELHCPVLIIAGGRDRHTTPGDTQQFFDAAADPKELWMIPEAIHQDFLAFRRSEYRTRVLGFLGRSFHRAIPARR